MQKDDSQKGFNLLLSEEYIEKLTTEEIYYFIENIKRLLYLMLDEIKQANIIGNKYIYDNITNENALLGFNKKIFIFLFH
jgi:hypothetical protein